MDDSRRFKLLWRVNAVLILVVLVFSIGSFVYYKLRRCFYRTDPASNLKVYGLSVHGVHVLKGKWSYGELREVPGASGFVVPLYSTWTPDEPRPNYPSLRNLLFVDASLKGTRWLFPDNQAHIREYHLLIDRDPRKALAILCETWDEPAGDVEQAADEPSRSSIYLSRPDCTGLVKVVAGLHRRIGHAVADENHVVVFYVKDNAGHAARISLSDFSVVERTTLAPTE